MNGENALGDFLKARRGRVRPDGSGAPSFGRRRVPGLRRDELAANKLAMALSPLYTPGRNLIRGMFLDPEARTLFPDWKEIAAQSAAALRAEADPRDPATADLITSLSADSHFRDVWAGYDVRPTRDEVKRFNHEIVGPLTLRRETLAIAGAEGQVIIAYQAAPETPAAQALARLL